MVDVDNGDPLYCQRRGIPAPFGESAVDLPGFDDQQNQQVLDLSKDLGADGFSDAGRTHLQDKVDQITASLPPGRRPYHRPFLWGGGLGVFGLVVMAVPVGLYACALLVWRPA